MVAQDAEEIRIHLIDKLTELGEFGYYGSYLQYMAKTQYPNKDSKDGREESKNISVMCRFEIYMKSYKKYMSDENPDHKWFFNAIEPEEGGGAESWRLDVMRSLTKTGYR